MAWPPGLSQVQRSAVVRRRLPGSGSRSIPPAPAESTEPPAGWCDRDCAQRQRGRSGGEWERGWRALREHGQRVGRRDRLNRRVQRVENQPRSQRRTGRTRRVRGGCRSGAAYAGELISATPVPAASRSGAALNRRPGEPRAAAMARSSLSTHPGSSGTHRFQRAGRDRWRVRRESANAHHSRLQQQPLRQPHRVRWRPVRVVKLQVHTDRDIGPVTQHASLGRWFPRAARTSTSCPSVPAAAAVAPAEGSRSAPAAALDPRTPAGSPSS